MVSYWKAVLKTAQLVKFGLPLWACTSATGTLDLPSVRLMAVLENVHLVSPLLNKKYSNFLIEL